ncbi:MAG: helix-turn-helix transcriptional regulator [Oscillospiraceae bacterium]|nr:helix-turn-helix transcriptional regulator [Oscillospiraceae bacterium]
MKIKTDKLENQLSEISDFSDYLEKNSENLISEIKLAEYLEQLLETTGCTKSYIIKQTNLNRAYVYQIFEGKKNPSRDKLIAIAFGMKLAFDEIQDLLKYAGMRQLYARDTRDAVIIFSVQHGYSFEKMNAFLYEQHLKTIE